MGDPAHPPPPPPYESPSERRRAVRESLRVTRRVGKEGSGEVLGRYDPGEAVGGSLKPYAPGRSDRQNQSPPIQSEEISKREPDCKSLATMASKEVQANSGAGSGRDGRPAGNATPDPRRRGLASTTANQIARVHVPPQPVGLLMAPPVGGGEQGGLAERPTRPKPTGGVSAVSLSRRRALLDADMAMEEDGNWDDGSEMEGLGFNQEDASKIGGTVNMEDDVYLEFDDEEESIKEKPDAPKEAPGKNALLVTDLDEAAQPYATKLDSVPVWVRIYDVPWGKQDDVWGRRYGNGLGEAIEVDVPASEQEKKEFLRVRVRLPYDRRLQTHITTGVKGKPRDVKNFKLKYERVPYYCSHCGFMGHKKDVCEKRRLGVPSLEYDAHELRCSPYKKFEHRTFFVPAGGQASAKRNLSFASFGSAESYKRFDQRQSRERRRNSVTPEHGNSHAGSVNHETMPPLMDDPALAVNMVVQEIGNEGVEGETILVKPEVEENLAERVDAMLMGPSQNTHQQAPSEGRDGAQPIIQFPDDEGQGTAEHGCHMQVSLTADMLAKLQQVHAQARQDTSSGYSWGQGPRPSDMIPALQGLSSLQVSFGSVNDISMPAADTVLGKRGAEDHEVQGERLELSLGLDYGGEENAGTSRKGKAQDLGKKQPGRRDVEMVYKRNRKMAPTGHTATGNLTRPNVWSRQEQ
ncbi:hypothetical protein ACQ4PT_005872 [Festuca glaucescens]